MTGHHHLERLTDEQLVARFQRGENAACEVLFDRYRNVIHAIVGAGEQDLAWEEDVAADIVCRVYTSMSAYRGDSSFATWLRLLAKRVFVDAVRKAAVRSHEIALLEDIAVGEDDPAELLAQGERYRQALEAVARLPEKPRVAVALCHLAGYSYEKAATMLGVPVGTVRSRVYGGVHQARKWLAEQDRASK